jgi:hypothetical protein
MTQPHSKDDVSRMAAWMENNAILAAKHPPRADVFDKAAAMLRAYAEGMDDIERYRWLRNRAVLFEFPPGHLGSPFVCCDSGMGDTVPIWGPELDSMLHEAMTAAAAPAEPEASRE